MKVTAASQTEPQNVKFRFVIHSEKEQFKEPFEQSEEPEDEPKELKEPLKEPEDEPKHGWKLSDSEGEAEVAVPSHLPQLKLPDLRQAASRFAFGIHTPDRIASIY